MEGLAKVKFQLTNNALVNRPIYIARPDIYSTIDLDAIIAYASKAAGINQSDMIVTLDALLDAFEYYVCNGHSFKIDGVGTFSLSMKTVSADLYSPDPVIGADAVSGIGINFRPDVSLKQLISSISLQTEPINPNGLPEFSEIVPTKVQVGKRSANLINHNPASFLYASNGETISLGGYNLKDGLSIDVEGVLGDAEVSETITLRGVNKACNNVYAKLTKSYSMIKTIVIKDGDMTIGSYEFNGEGLTDVVSAYYGQNLITNGARFTQGTGKLSVRGNVDGVVVMVDGTVLTPSSTTENRADFANFIVTTGSHTISVNGKEFTFEIVDTAVANINALSANGVTVANGATSPVRAHQSYTFVATGNNVNLIEQSDIEVPAGALVSGFSKTNNQVTFTVVMGTEGGTIKVGNFSCTVTITADPNAPSITYGTVSNNGSITVTAGSSRPVEFNGQNLQNVAVVRDGSEISATKTETSVSFSASAGSYVIYADNTRQESLIKFTVVEQESSGGYGDD